MVGEIIYSDYFRDELDALAQILFAKNYFGFIEDADFYIDRIYDFVDFNIDKPISKPTPCKFQKFGKFYLKYKANQRTTWYVFFDQKDHRFLVNYIMNNHSGDFPDLV